ncbi:phenylacetate--CoA ligase family protein [Candidatus Lokiarchaeum ossiferum]|uniref:phenylacetate--CoA ligase family protein n=1 Tax=Candidatus Lokiarchaeum ossiferum TaxID=2951803 RepID=UPI00352CE402
MSQFDLVRSKSVAFLKKKYSESYLQRFDYFKRLKQLEESQYYSESDLYELKYNRLIRLVHFCADNVPFYQRIIKRNRINIQNVKDIEVFENVFPIITKSEIQQNYNQFISNKIQFPPINHNSTGGSTGNPLNFLQDRLYYCWKFADRLRHLKWCNWTPWDKIAYLWGSNKDFLNFKQNGIVGIKEILSNEMFLNSFHMDNQKILHFSKKINKFKPKLIIGYANSLNLFAQFLEQNKIDLTWKNFVIQSSAETLTPHMRKQIEKSFHAPVFNSYGSREISSIAHECRFHSGLHISEEIRHLEIINSNNEKSKKGKIVLTDLTNYVFPFLRYENGDVGEFTSNQCKCGRNLKLLNKIYGRSSDFIQTPNGKIIHGEYFTHLFYNQDLIKNFQVIQESINMIRINYSRIKNREDNQLTKILQKIEYEIKNQIDQQLVVEFFEIDEIDTSLSGKRRFVVSKIKINF